MNRQFKPNTTVAAIIHHNGKFLIVEEVDNGNVVYNQPAGHIEPNENLIESIKREVFEETGIQINPDYISGIYYHYSETLNLYYLRFCFVCELDEFEITEPHDDDIIQAVWLSHAEIVAKGSQLRSPLVLQCLQDYMHGKHYPLEILHTNIEN